MSEENRENNDQSQQIQQNQTGIFRKFLNGISYIGSLFCSKCFNKLDRGDDDDNDINLNELVLKDIPGRVQSFKEFNSEVKKYVGILILYNENQMNQLRSLVSEMNKDENSYVKDILSVNFKLFSAKYSSEDGKNVYPFYNLYYITFLS